MILPMFEPKIWKKSKKNALEHCREIRIVRLVRIESVLHVKFFLKTDSLHIILYKKTLHLLFDPTEHFVFE